MQILQFLMQTFTVCQYELSFLVSKQKVKERVRKIFAFLVTHSMFNWSSNCQFFIIIFAFGFKSYVPALSILRNS